MFGLLERGLAFLGTKLFKLGIKPLKYWIDSTFRDSVSPVKGSVLYADLGLIAEHSGICVGSEQISNITVTGLASSEVEQCGPRSFTSKSFAKKIYVSCDKHGAVGDALVSNYAEARIGESKFYGLLFKNCHEFSSRCLDESSNDYKLSFWDKIEFDPTWEATITQLKKRASEKLGATKWRLWDWQNEGRTKVEQPNEEKSFDFFENLNLNDRDSIRVIKEQLIESKLYLEEIKDENIPPEAIKQLKSIENLLTKVDQKYEEAKEFMALSGFGYSYKELMQMNENLAELAKELGENSKIKAVVNKLGRSYILPSKKLRTTACKRMKNETHGIHKSNDLTRLLPSEIVNFEDEDLEYLFYSKYLEESLLTYELKGTGTEETDHNEAHKGPVIACLDTSGSMSGQPILKAKALLLSVAKILKKENRSLHILLFGSSGQLSELELSKPKDASKLIPFLSKGFNGGTDFDTPLKRAIQIIAEKKIYHKADILMITDGACGISEPVCKEIGKTKESLGYSIYTVNCVGTSPKDSFSDEALSI